ncbi:MAG: hypothetical protein WD005_04905 [Haliea sp.]
MPPERLIAVRKLLLGNRRRRFSGTGNTCSNVEEGLGFDAIEVDQSAVKV